MEELKYLYGSYALELGGHNEIKIGYEGACNDKQAFLLRYRDYSFEELIARLGFLLWEDDVGAYRASCVAEVFNRFFAEEFKEKLKAISLYKLPLSYLSCNWEELKKKYRLIKHEAIELPEIIPQEFKIMGTPRGFWWDNDYYNLDVVRYREGGDDFIVEPYTEKITTDITVLLGGLND